MPEIYLYMSKLLTEILTKRVDLCEEKKTILLYQIRVIIAEQTKLINRNRQVSFMKKNNRIIILLVLAIFICNSSLAVYAKTKNISKSFKTKKPVVDVRGSIENEKGISLTEISWSKVKGADGYKIYKKDNTGKKKLIKKVTKNECRIFVKNKSKGSYCRYYVRAYKRINNKNIYSKFGFNKFILE